MPCVTALLLVSPELHTLPISDRPGTQSPVDEASTALQVGGVWLVKGIACRKQQQICRT